MSSKGKPTKTQNRKIAEMVATMTFRYAKNPEEWTMFILPKELESHILFGKAKLSYKELTDRIESILEKGDL